MLRQACGVCVVRFQGAGGGCPERGFAFKKGVFSRAILLRCRKCLIPKSASFEHMKSVEPRRILFFMFEPALFRRGAFPAKKEEDA